MFASFRPTAEVQRYIAVRQPKKSSPLDMQRGVERYARATLDIEQMKQNGLDPMPHQISALDKARGLLDQVRPYAGRDAATAFARQPELLGDAAGGRTSAVLRAMQLEAEIRINPELRADRFVENWQKLSRQHQQMVDKGDHGRARAFSKHMSGMAERLERDPQVESLLRNRKAELGLQGRGSDGGIAHQLVETLGIKRTRDLGIGM